MAINRPMARLAICAAAAMVACGGGGEESTTESTTESATESAVRTTQGCVARTERLVVVSGDRQTGLPGAALAKRPTVSLSCESYDNRGRTLSLAGARIDWRNETGPATNLVGGRPQVTRRTAADGTSAVVWTLGKAYASTMRIEARHQPATGAPLTVLFSARSSGTTAPRCEDPGGTDHGRALSIASSTVWRAADSPHRGGTVTLTGDSALLSIEAGAVVCVGRIEARAGTFGSVSAVGTAQAPIRFIGTALRAGGELAQVIGDNMPAVGTTDHPVGSLTDSTFDWSKRRGPALCAQIVVGDMGSGAGATLNRVSIRGYGSARCAALALIQPENAWDYGSVPIEVRVQGSIGDGIAVAPIFNTAMSIDFVNCEVSSSGGHGIVVAAHAKATIPWVGTSGCNLFGNGGDAIVNRSAASVGAIGNWWGDPAGLKGPSGDGVSGAVDASGPLAGPRVLGY